MGKEKCGTSRVNVDARARGYDLIELERVAVDKLVSVPTPAAITHLAGISNPVTIQHQQEGMIVWCRGSIRNATTQDSTVRAMQCVGARLSINDNQAEVFTDGTAAAVAYFANLFGIYGGERMYLMRKVTINMKWQISYQNDDAATDWIPTLVFGFVSKARAQELGIWDDPEDDE